MIFPISLSSSLQIFPITTRETASPFTIFEIVVGEILVLAIRYLQETQKAYWIFSRFQSIFFTFFYQVIYIYIYIYAFA